MNIEHVGYRWKYEDEDKWSLVKHVPTWYKDFMRDVILEKVYVVKEKR